MLAMMLATPAVADDDRVTELERKVDALTREIESLKLGAAADTTTGTAPRFGLGPAASRVYGRPQGVSLGGYGEMLFEQRDRRSEGGALVSDRSRLDLLRAVLYVGYKFSDELLLNSEIELEHSGVFDRADVAVDPGSGQGGAELSGEATLEFAYLEWSRRRAFAVRAGKLLVPVGLTNEFHEPPVFLGARRPDVESAVIPTTWAANGAGVAGELASGLAYRAYVMEGLDAARFDADNAIREGRQDGSQALATHPAWVARVDWTGTPGLLIGGSAYTGDAWQRAQPAGMRLAPRVTLLDAHARLDWRGLQARALYAAGTLDQAAKLSDALGLTGTDRLGKRFFGGYLEAGYDVMPRLAPSTRWALLPFARWEEYDTQDGVVAPGAVLAARHHNVITAGLALKPHPSVVVKADREWRHSETDTDIRQWNLALGWLF